jgi:hypothetical protein
MSIREVQLTSIANAVDAIDVEYRKEPAAERRWRMENHAEHIRDMVKQIGGKCAANPYYHDVQYKQELAFPGKPWGDRTMTVKPWPTAAEGTVVEIDGVAHTVVVNRTWGGVSGQYVPVFSIYAVIPA